MHEPFDPHCSHCVKFVYCFAEGGPLADWGYCEEEMVDGPPSEDDLRALEEAARRGDYTIFLSPSLPFYQESDDGCSRYVPR